jgi:hypothetical protein
MQLQIKIINNFSIFSNCAVCDELLDSGRLSSETIPMANSFREIRVDNNKNKLQVTKTFLQLLKKLYINKLHNHKSNTKTMQSRKDLAIKYHFVRAYVLIPVQ